MTAGRENAFAPFVINRVSTSSFTWLDASALWNPALHGAMNARSQESDLGLAVERQQCRAQQLGAEAGRADLIHRRAFGLVPGHVEAVVRYGPRHLQQPARRGKGAIFCRVGRK